MLDHRNVWLIERMRPGTRVAVGGKLLGNVYLAESNNGLSESLSAASSSHVRSQTHETYHVVDAGFLTAS